MYKTIGITALVGCVASIASGQSIPSGMYIDGDVRYEYYRSNDGNSLSMFLVDTTIGIEPGAVGSVPIGAEIYLSYLYNDTTPADADQLTFGGVVYYDSSYGRFSLGTPHSVIGDYVDTPSLGGFLDNSFLGIFYSGYTDLVIKIEDVSNYGVRYDGSFGDLSIGASYHMFPDSNFSSFTIAARYDLGNVDVALGYEDFSEGAIFYASAAVTYSALDATLTLSSPTSEGLLIYGLDLSYAVLPNLDLGLTYVSFDGTDNFSMLSAEYAFYQNAYVGVRYYPEFIEGDSAYAIYAGYNLDF